MRPPTRAPIGRRLCAALLAACAASAAAQPDPKQRDWERMMSRSTVLGIQLSARRELQARKTSKAYVDCTEGIDPDAFSDIYKGVMERILTPEEIRFAEAFWESEVGARTAELVTWAQYHDLGLPPPHAPNLFTPGEQAAADEYNRSTAAGKLAAELDRLHSRMEPEAEARARSLMAMCRARAHEVQVP
jgi:hypothetical protein